MKFSGITMRRSCKLLLAALMAVTGLNLFKFWCSEDYKDWVEAEQDEIDLKSVFKRFNTNDVFYRWHTCISEQLLWIDDPEKFWDDFMFASQRCDLRANVQQIGLVTLRNMDEQKHVIFPKIYNFGPHNLFSVGIGRDISAERQFRRKMQKLGNNVTFHGADPVSFINDELYSRIGTYYPLAIGAQSGISNAMVMIEDGGYAKKSMIHIDILYFFKNLLNVTKIDNLWFDAEGAEFGPDFFDIFYKNGRFDQNGIDICQINIEIHKHQEYPERKKEFMVFVKRLINEKRFGIFGGDQYIHNRMYMFNFESQFCLKKYLNKFA